MKYEFEMPHRIDILCSAEAQKLTIFPCEKCKRDDCEGKKECKGFGSYVLGLSLS